SATRSYGGTGLGLALVKQIMHAHGTRVDVESTPGVGSTLRIRLPIVEAHA
ncbi:MAG: histidine kinase, partial [candidate division NC10 bacterium]|nr:histidine kinase [candidate division NC10 bacterium]